MPSKFRKEEKSPPKPMSPSSWQTSRKKSYSKAVLTEFSNEKKVCFCFEHTKDNSDREPYHFLVILFVGTSYVECLSSAWGIEVKITRAIWVWWHKPVVPVLRTINSRLSLSTQWNSVPPQGPKCCVIFWSHFDNKVCFESEGRVSY